MIMHAIIKKATFLSCLAVLFLAATQLHLEAEEPAPTVSYETNIPVQ
jgi:hypothetical protein